MGKGRGASDMGLAFGFELLVFSIVAFSIVLILAICKVLFDKI